MRIVERHIETLNAHMADMWRQAAPVFEGHIVSDVSAMLGLATRRWSADLSKPPRYRIKEIQPPAGTFGEPERIIGLDIPGDDDYVLRFEARQPPVLNAWHDARVDLNVWANIRENGSTTNASVFPTLIKPDDAWGWLEGIFTAGAGFVAVESTLLALGAVANTLGNVLWSVLDGVLVDPDVEVRGMKYELTWDPDLNPSPIGAPTPLVATQPWQTPVENAPNRRVDWWDVVFVNDSDDPAAYTAIRDACVARLLTDTNDPGIDNSATGSGLGRMRSSVRVWELPVDPGAAGALTLNGAAWFGNLALAAETIEAADNFFATEYAEVPGSLHPTLVYVKGRGGRSRAFGNTVILRSDWDPTSAATASASATWAASVLVHELGHIRRFGLADEYQPTECILTDPNGGEYRRKQFRGDLDFFPNVSTRSNEPDWEDALGAPVAGIEGAFEHCWNVYRPEATCRMRSSAPGAFCKVCARAIEDGHLAQYGVDAPTTVQPLRRQTPPLLLSVTCDSPFRYRGRHLLRAPIATNGQPIQRAVLPLPRLDLGGGNRIAATPGDMTINFLAGAFDARSTGAPDWEFRPIGAQPGSALVNARQGVVFATQDFLELTPDDVGLLDPDLFQMREFLPGGNQGAIVPNGGSVTNRLNGSRIETILLRARGGIRGLAGTSIEFNVWPVGNPAARSVVSVPSRLWAANAVVAPMTTARVSLPPGVYAWSAQIRFDQELLGTEQRAIDAGGQELSFEVLRHPALATDAQLPDPTRLRLRVPGQTDSDFSLAAGPDTFRAHANAFHPDGEPIWFEYDFDVDVSPGVVDNFTRAFTVLVGRLYPNLDPAAIVERVERLLTAYTELSTTDHLVGPMEPRSLTNYFVAATLEIHRNIVPTSPDATNPLRDWIRTGVDADGQNPPLGFVLYALLLRGVGTNWRVRIRDAQGRTSSWAIARLVQP